ncbi:uncharacterized protein TRUGW13939_02474 [Talaromyces rugulosus]|uniref:Carrier domain-containing protein n=1 Tax=Talaromyces rugulosus TaxID=121627 RepID=A0A7H8QNE8_TALRU|nr:uncharacterized protein TRUGW13939_02474 [Talaromyces rugulosus]QKX55382.1 hypothetical protein TRUGW13939_02474 [Talaromyces rugulosus]
MAPLPKNLFEALTKAARSAPEKGLSIYPPGQTEGKPTRITYSELLRDALIRGNSIKTIPGLTPDKIVLIHLDNHEDNVRWLWAVLAAGQVPAISVPFTNNLDQRRKHIEHLQEVLHDPVVLTRKHLVAEFLDLPGLAIHPVEELDIHNTPFQVDYVLQNGFTKSPDDLAALMLTSGSTGNAKAVALRHGQMLNAVAGKSACHATHSDEAFLNWIGMDHVANLTEVHLHAMTVGADQVHVHAGDLLANPLLFLQLIDRHAVGYTFAPNFFLASVRKALEKVLLPHLPVEKAASLGLPNISTLRCLISGGEANSTALCAALTKLLQPLGGSYDFIRPGFGMTETCAGSIYNIDCPRSDLALDREFTSLGYCIPGMEMRVRNAEGGNCGANDFGHLEVRGVNVFNEYYNNPTATQESFTPDGWFVTGDLAFLDEKRRLHMIGRGKESININGLKYYPHEIEGAIEDAHIPGVTPSYTAIFPYRVPGAASETLCAVYLPTYAVDEISTRLNTRDKLRTVIMQQCMVRPYRIIPLDREFLPKTALGKLSRAKIRKAFEAGMYNASIKQDEIYLAQATGAAHLQPTTPAEVAVQAIFAEVFGASRSELGIHTSMLDMGCSSIEIFQIKWLLQNDPALVDNVPITTIIGHPTIQGLAAALDPAATGVSKPYDPVVKLRQGGSKTPLWLVHPGVGEVLVFLTLANQFTDRPVYALRARGFDGEPFFGSVDEMVDTYREAIQRVQPTGPYAIAGYSYGGTVSFEIAKKLNRDGFETPFLAVFDQPPHIKDRMRHGGWADVLLTLARFFDLLPNPEDEETVAAELRAVGGGLEDDTNKDKLVDILLSSASNQRLQEFGLDKNRLATWTSLALNSHTIARHYEPQGNVPLLEVFYGQPIEAVARTKAEWLEHKLSRWNQYVTDVQFHEVAGHHYTLLAPENVQGFYRTLQTRLEARGV